MTRKGFGLGVALAVAGVVAYAGDALACGGCFAPTETQQVVTDHRMVLSIGATESVLWDQIRYSGNPAEFSWVLPVTGDVTIELGSSLFIDTIDSLTAPVVQAPPPHQIDCGCYPDYDNGGPYAGGAADAGTAAADGGSPPVTVVSEATVGPYETVVLRSTDATALTDWLTAHNYAIPASIQPVIQAYVDQHMDFVALRLLPGEGVDAMQPVKIRYHTANMVLPLRMVGAGISDKVGISLYVFGLGRHEAANFGNGVIDERQLTWDWNTRTSDYPQVFTNTLRNINSGRGWITQYADNTVNLQYSVQSATQLYCLQHLAYDYSICGQLASGQDAGVAPPANLTPAEQAALDDVAALYADWNLATNNGAPDTWVTRLRTDLLARFLDADLIVQPRLDNSPVPSLLRVTNETGPYPTVCTYHYCASDAGYADARPSDAWVRPDAGPLRDGGASRDGAASSDAGDPTVGGGANCAASPTAGGARHGILGTLGALGLAAFVARRRRR